MGWIIHHVHVTIMQFPKIINCLKSKNGEIKFLDMISCK